MQIQIEIKNDTKKRKEKYSRSLNRWEAININHK